MCRFDQVVLDSGRRQRIRRGLDFRPIKETVFKLDIEFNFEDWSGAAVPNDAILFSVATYF